VAGIDSNDDFKEISPEVFLNHVKGIGKGNVTKLPKKK
jgi:hypothetical protein